MATRVFGRLRHSHALFAGLLTAGLAAAVLVVPQNQAVAAPCDPPIVNAIACENSMPGSPESEWGISGAGSAAIQGFATDMSVDQGGTIGFKVDTTASSYRLDIYRMGYYGGDGARRVATVQPTSVRSQPDCLSDSTTGLVDCGNWSLSASWAVPGDAVSGIYFAKLLRTDGTNGASHVFFVVRDDDGGSDVLFQTADTTWQAYNRYGGNSLYTGSPAGRAYKVSYNRPFTTRDYAPEDFVFNAEYPMVRWLEANGYDVSYTTGVDTARFGAELLEHRAFMSVGHDEYWSGEQRANVEAARAAGVNLAFFSGNEVFWKTRWENGIDGSATPFRTLVSYKETHANAKIDPSPSWTGTWRDPRYSPPSDGGRPENALTGTAFMVNCCAIDMEVGAADGKMRFWRNTPVANLTGSQIRTIGSDVIGYEWDEDLDNGHRPPGLFRISETSGTGEVLQNYGSQYAAGSATHAMTMYRHASGALVFGAGTIQWPWALDSEHDRGSAAADPVARQATVNLLADMGAQPATLQPGLVPASPSTDTTAPTSTIASPTAGQTFSGGAHLTVTGTAADTGGLVGGVEVSTDGGNTWHPAQGRETWSYAFTAPSAGEVTIKSRAVDDSGRIETPSAGVTITVGDGPVTCPCTIWPDSATPGATDSDASPVELGVKFRAAQDGFITGIRFYKSTQNTGTHVGSLWTGSGTKLSTVTFTGETASGWQQATLPSPVPVTAGTTYVASYHAPNARYSVDPSYFASSGTTRGPLTALQNGIDGGNGVYRYGSTPGEFPTNAYESSNYWVDVVFDSGAADTTKPTVTSRSPAAGATGVPVTSSVAATFSEPVTASSVQFELRDASASLVPATTSYDAGTRTATLTPQQPLATSQTYTARLSGATDSSGNVMDPVTWTFTTSASTSGCPCTIWADTTTPGTPAEADSSSVEVGVRFRAAQDGYITGIRFYKGSGNTGTHVGSLWSNTGTRLASVTFNGETPTGWQQASFGARVPVTAGTTYVASYHAPAGRYAVDAGYFTGAGVTRGPLTALQTGVDGANGVYQYGAAQTFPTSTFEASNYWVDVVFDTTADDTVAPTVIARSPASGASGVPVSTAVTATFSEPVSAGSVAMGLRDPSNNPVPGTVAYNGTTSTATFTPQSALANSTTYTARVSGATDTGGNVMSPVSWTFTTTAPPPPPPDQGPGGPIAVVTNGPASSSTYLVEMLRAEGFNEFTNVGVGSLDADNLAGYDVLVLGAVPLTSSQVTTLTNWVNAGGNLIAMRPSSNLTSLLGLIQLSGTTSNGYLAVNAATQPGAGITTATMQFHGPANRYLRTDATEIARMYSSATRATMYPAVTWRNVGSNGGQAAAFAYDLARSVIETRQGNPAWAGQERDDSPPIRSDDQFFGGTSADWVNLNKVHIPQADEQQRLLANLITVMNQDRKPLPRFWYFPDMHKAVVVATGDDHANGGTAGRFDTYRSAGPAGCSVVQWTCPRFTSYVYPNSPLSGTQAAAYTEQGFEVGLHPQNGCANYSSLTALQATYTQDLGAWQQRYSSIPSPVSNRFHCLVWSDWASQPKAEAAHGMRLDVNYYYWPGSWVGDRPGFMTGSGIPMRFADTDGSLIDVYQSATVMTDESGQSYPFTPDTLLDRALGPQGTYGAFTANLHTDRASTFEDDQVLASAKQRGVPVISARQLLTWTDGRGGSSFSGVTWSADTLSFDIAVGQGATGLTAMLPVSGPQGRVLSTLTLGGIPVPFNSETIKGQQYAVFPAQPGSYQATYAASGPLDVTAARAGQVTSSGATLQWRTDEPATTAVEVGPRPGRITARRPVAERTQSHLFRLRGLSPATTYYYRVRSTDGSGNTRAWPARGKPPASFTTRPADLQAPAISRVRVLPLPDGTARATWRSSEPADSLVAYGPNRRLNRSGLDTDLVRRHVVVVTGLLPDRTYWVRVSSTDASGNTGTQVRPVRFVTTAAGVADHTSAQFRTGSESGQAVVREAGFGAVGLRGAGPRRGTFVSGLLDARQMVDWDRALWRAADSPGSTLRISVRTGSTARPDRSWSEWRTLGGRGARVGATGRYLQYRAEMTARGPEGPVLQAIGFTHNGTLPLDQGEHEGP
ncbi:MAG: DUF4082 domain-containing protein [Propionibacteriales bacterium]|nr:DUF4082 domain-containing protein [Propionibacteriales bacterium]